MLPRRTKFMRKAQKKQIMDFAMLLEEAHDELKEKINTDVHAGRHI